MFEWKRLSVVQGMSVISTDRASSVRSELNLTYVTLVKLYRYVYVMYKIPTCTQHIHTLRQTQAGNINI